MFKLLFLTSNRTKMQHARYLCRAYNIEIVSKSYYGVAYKEPRTSDRAALLKGSIRDATERLIKQVKGKAPEINISLFLNKLFFIEDTSVVIHALSDGENEIPGTEIKFWMQEHDFKSVDKILKELGNDRRATVRSDIILTFQINVLNRLAIHAKLKFNVSC